MGRFEAPSLRRGTGGRFSDGMRKLYYDTVLYTEDALRLLIKTVGVDRCLFGTEYPGVGSSVDPATGRSMDNVKPMIENIEWLSAADRKKIFEDNARAVLKVIVELESVTMHRLRIYGSNRSAVQDVQADQSERGVQRSIVQVQSQGGFQVQGSKFKVFHRGLDLQIIDVVAVVEGHL